MNDSYYEQIVKGKAKAGTIALNIGMIVLALLSLFLMMFIPFLMLTLVAAIVVFILYSYPRMKVEYEYMVLNSELDISMIFNKSKRKEVLSLDLKKAEIIAPINSAEIRGYNKTKDFTSAKESYPIYGIVYAEGNGKACLKISPDEKMLKHLKDWAGINFKAY